MAEQNEPKDASQPQPHENLPPAEKNVRIEQFSQGNRGQTIGNVNNLVINNYASDVQTVRPELTGKLRDVLGPNPYKGLEAFEREDAENFWGRQAQIEELYEKLKSLYVSPTSVRLLPIYGPSGSGKSSLAKAGVIPYLENHPFPGMKALKIIQFRPGTMPLSSLEAALIRTENDIDLSDKVSRDLLARPDENNQNVYNGLQRSVCFLSNIARSPLIILIDQFEEVYSLCKDAKERHIFINNLLAAASDPSRYVVVILTLRSDFLREVQQDRLANGTTLSELFSSQGFLVPAMTLANLREAIVKPAEQAGYRLEPAVVDLLIEKTKEREGALPLLQFALQRIWNGLAEEIDPVITLREIGGVGGALADKAQEIYDRLTEAEQEIARRVFIGLVQLGEGTRDTRRRVTVNTLIVQYDTPERVQQVIRQFSSPEARLISLSSAEGDEIAEVTHEALFDHWHLLNSWLDSSRDSIRFHRRLEVAAHYWNEKNRPDGLLWRSPDLELLREYQRRAAQDMTDIEAAFWQVSEQAAQDQKRNKRLLTGVLALGFIVTSVLAGFAFMNARVANRRSLEAELNRIRNLAQSSATLQASGKTFEGLIMALRAGKAFKEGQFLDPVTLNQIEREFLSALLTENRELNRLEGHSDSVRAVQFSRDGDILATASEDGTAKLWNTADGRLLHTLEGHSEWWVYDVQFSRDGDTLATASGDGTAKLWSTADGKLLHTFEGHNNAVTAIQFSRDGDTLATASEDGTAKLWSTAEDRLIATLEGHSDWVAAIQFSPDDHILATVSQDGTAKLWSTADGRLLKTLGTPTTPLDGYFGMVYAVRFSPDGATLATTSQDANTKLWSVAEGTLLRTLESGAFVTAVQFSLDGAILATTNTSGIVKLWNTADGRLRNTLEGHREWIYAAQFSPDGDSLATASQDGTAKLWSMADSKLITTLEHSKWVYDVQFSRDGDIIATASRDGTAKLWSTTDGRLLHTLKGLENHSSAVNTFQFSPDGDIIATASGDRTARLWSTADGRLLHTFEGHKNKITAVQFSPDGDIIATASWDGTAKLWSTTDGRLLKTLEGHSDWVYNVQFSRDGDIIATASRDGTAKLWSTTDGRLLHTLEGHSTWQVYDIQFSLDGDIIATASGDGTAKLWSTTDGTLLHTLDALERPSSAVPTFQFSPDGNVIATASKVGTTKLWSTADGKLLHTLKGHSLAVEFSSDGNTLATASGDGTARLWSTADGKLLHTFEGHNSMVTAVQFNSDSDILATASWDGTAKLWPWTIDTLMSYTCQRMKNFLISSPNSEMDDKTLCS
ncbi:MAG: hypothetical protein AAFQ63_14255 [Cyanobacteria bacterium J06621_11]